MRIHEHYLSRKKGEKTDKIDFEWFFICSNYKQCTLTQIFSKNKKKPKRFNIDIKLEIKNTMKDTLIILNVISIVYQR